MARVLTKKSTVAAKVPLATDLEIGELAVNTADAKLYTKHSDNTVKQLGIATSDSRLTDAREWTASTVTQAEAEAGTATTRRAWTAQRVFQAIAAWWAASAMKTKLDGIAAGATANATDAQLRDRATHTGSQAISTVTGLQTALDGKISTTERGVSGGIPTLDEFARIPASQLPSYVDDVLEYPTREDFPATGEGGKIYIAVNQGTAANPTVWWRWTGTTYVDIPPSPGTTDALVEGSTNLYFSENRVRNTALTGLSLASSAAVAATDSVLTAFGKLQAQLGLKAPLDSPALTGNPTAPTPASTDNDTSIATTAFVHAAMGLFGVGGKQGTARTIAQATTNNDCDELNTTGVYTSAGAANSPYSTTTVLHMERTYGAGVTATQIAASPDGLNYRVRLGADWQPWKRMVSTDDMAAEFTAHGFNATSNALNNDANTSGLAGTKVFSTISTTANSPMTQWQQVLDLYRDAGNTAQLSLGVQSDRAFFRRKNANTWYGWKEFAFTDSPTFSGSLNLFKTGSGSWGNTTNALMRVVSTANDGSDGIAVHSYAPSVSFVDHTGAAGSQYAYRWRNDGGWMRLDSSSDLGATWTKERFMVSPTGDISFTGTATGNGSGLTNVNATKLGGTAAANFWHTGNLVKQTSPTDTTAGAMMAVGAFGWGESSPASITDIDAMRPAQVVRVSAETAGNPNPGSGTQILCFSEGVDYGSQLAFCAGGDINNFPLKHRMRTSPTTWGPWVSYWHTGNFNPATKQDKSALVTTATSRTLALTDAWNYLRPGTTSAITLTVPTNASVAFEIGTEITVRALGNITLAAASGVTLNAPSGGTHSMNARMTVTLKKVATNEWDVIGQTVAA